MVPIILSLLFGFLTGWLINYLADVMPIKRKLTNPVCVRCQQYLSWQDYILFRACGKCGRKAGLRRYLVLAFCACAAGYLWLHPATRLGFGGGWLLGSYLLLVAIIDLEHRLVLHPTSIFGAVICLGIGIQLHGIGATILGGLAGFGIMFALFYLGDLFARWVAKLRGQELDEVALGFGDVILSTVLGLVLGWPGIIGGLVLAILLGGMISVGYILTRVAKRDYQPFTAIPYAPFLILGALFLLFRV